MMTNPVPTGRPVREAPQQGRRAEGLFGPRWLLLAGIWFTLALAVGYSLHYFYSYHDCNFGAICSLDQLPTVAQVPLILGGFFLMLVVARLYGGNRIPDGGSNASRNGFDNLMYSLSSYQHVRPFAWGIAILTFIGLALAAIEGRLDGGTISLGVIALLVSGRCALSAGARRTHAQTQPGAATDSPEQQNYESELARNAGFWGQLRNLPGVEFFLRDRFRNTTTTNP